MYGRDGTFLVLIVKRFMDASENTGRSRPGNAQYKTIMDDLTQNYILWAEIEVQETVRLTYTIIFLNSGYEK